jgi:hypothetical protein
VWRPNVGVSYGKPVLAKTQAAGWVVLVPPVTMPGMAVVICSLDARAGGLIRDIRTEDGSSGLAQVSAWPTTPCSTPVGFVSAATSRATYGARPVGPAPTDWKVVKLARSPILQAWRTDTTPPELAQDGRA